MKTPDSHFPYGECCCGGTGVIHVSFGPDRPCPCTFKNSKVRIENNQNTQTQIINFVGGIKRTIHGVVSVWENEMTHIRRITGVEWIIRRENVLCIEKKLIENDKGD